MMFDRERPAVYHASPHATTEDTSAPQEENYEAPPTRHQGAHAARPQGPGRDDPASPGGRGRESGGGPAPRRPDHHPCGAGVREPRVTGAAGPALSLLPSRNLLRRREHEPRRPHRTGDRAPRRRPRGP